MNEKIRKAIDFAVDLIYPNCCPCCRKTIAVNKLVCENCDKKLRKMQSMDITTKSKEYVDGGYSAFEYNDTTRPAMLEMKHGFGTQFIDYTLDLRLEEILNNSFLTSCEAVYAVPSAERYNHSQIIAEKLGKFLDIPVLENLVYKRKFQKSQHTLDYRNRVENAKKSFILNDKCRKTEFKRILLCDDIITTGNTVERIAALLKQNGVEKVFAFSLCGVADAK